MDPIIIPPFPPFQLRNRAFSNVQPFTYDDGITHFEILDELVAYFVTEIGPWLEALPEQLKEFGDGIEADVNAMLDELKASIDQSLAGVVDAVNDALAAQDGRVDQTIADLEAFVNNAVQQIINSTIEVSDPVIAGILNDAETETNAILDGRYNTGTHVYVASNGSDDNKGNIYTSPFATIQRALEYIGDGSGVIYIAPGDVIECEPFVLDVRRHAIEGRLSELSFVNAPPNADCISLRGSRGSDLEQNRAVLSGLVIRGARYTTQEEGQTGIRYFSPDVSGRISPSHTFIEQVNITDFKYGITYGDNTYILALKDSTIRHCGWCVYVPSGITNSGEKMLFDNCTFADSVNAIWSEAANVELFFVGCSFDYLTGGRVMYLSASRASLYACHVELDRNKDNPVFEFRGTGANFTMHGGRLSFNQSEPALAPQFVLNAMPGEGQAAVFDGVSFNGTLLPGGRFAHGTGVTIVKNAIYSGGATGAESAISLSANALIDATFSQTSVVDDWFISADSVAPTTRALAGTNIEGSLTAVPTYPGSDRSLRFRKNASQGAAAAATLFVPLGYDQSRNLYGQFRVQGGPGSGSATLRIYAAQVNDMSKLPTIQNVPAGKRTTLIESTINVGSNEWQFISSATRKRVPSWANALIVVLDMTGSTGSTEIYVGYQHVSAG